MKTTTTFKEILANELLATLESVTTPQRKVETASKEAKAVRKTKFPHKELGELYNKFRPDVSEQYIRVIYEIIGVAFEDKDLVKFAQEEVRSASSSKTRITFPVYTVILLTKNESSHSYPLNTPLIYLHTNGYLLNLDGRTDRTTIRDEKMESVQIATKEQVIDCVSTLTDTQWRTILSNDLFLSIREKAINREVILPEPAKSK